MKKSCLIFLLFSLITNISIAQNYGNFPKIEKQKLLNDLELLYQGLDKFHSGMYWYTTKSEFDSAFNQVKTKIDQDLNVLEFHKSIAPLVSLSREGHTKVIRPDKVKSILNKETPLFPLTVIFLDRKLYVTFNGSNIDSLQGLEIETINGEKPIIIANKLSQLITSDGYNQSAKRYYLRSFSFSEKYYYWYGITNKFRLKFKEREKEITLEPLTVKKINENLKKRRVKKNKAKKRELLEYRIIKDSIAYLGIHTFSNDNLTERYGKAILDSFLKASFTDIASKKIHNLIIDVSKNGGGTEGNGSLLYSYLGENFQKYKKVKANANKVTLNNGVDNPVKFTVYPAIERVFCNKKMEDGSFERKEWPGAGLIAYKKEPTQKFMGKTYIIIGPGTYSGGSEFANMMYSQTNAVFVGQETGGGYYGNTSGYSRILTLPNSQIKIKIPALQFEMNVKPTLPFGSGVIPHYKVIPTIEQALDRRNMPIEFILNKIVEGEKGES
ncbi:MAG: S41 family peptidase [Flavobacteriales bacterium]